MHMRWLKTTIGTGVLAALSTNVAAVEFQFDGGTNQGWETRLINSDGAEVVPRGPAGWHDGLNYPDPPVADPIGDGVGSIFTLGGAAPGRGLSRVVQFFSPDLSGDAMWQDLRSFSGQLKPAFAGVGDFFGNALLTIEDTTGGGSSERTFATSPGLIDVSEWNTQVFPDIDTFLPTQGVSSYVTKGVGFQFFFDDIANVETGFNVDAVVPVRADDPPVEMPAPGTLALFGAGLVFIGAGRRCRPT